MKVEFLHKSILIHKRFKGSDLFDISHTNHSVDMYFDTDYNATVIDNFLVDSNTVTIRPQNLINVLADLYKSSPFRNLEFTGAELLGMTAKEVMNAVKLKVSKTD